MRLSSAGSDGFAWLIGAGSRLRIASKTTAEVSPWNGSDPGGRLVQDRPQREEVGARVGDLPARLLGRHVGDRAHRRARGGELVRLHRGGRLGVLRPRAGRARSILARPKSRIFAWPRALTKMLAGLRSRWTMPFACADSSASAIWIPSSSSGPTSSGPLRIRSRQRLALEQLHRDEVLALVLVDLVDGADPGVVEGGSGAGLALEALERGRVLRHLRGQELERDVAAELRVLGLVHDAHARRCRASR